MTKINLEYFGMPGSGATVKEAKQDAGHRIEQALEGDYNPIVIRFRDHMLVVARDPKLGWGYRIVYPDVKSVRDSLYLQGTEDDRETCIAHAVRHLADILREYRESPENLLPLFDGAIYNRRLSGETYREWQHYCEMSDETNRRYRYAKRVMGLPENEAHNFAHCHPNFRDPAQSVPDSYTGLETEHSDTCMTNFPECGPIHCTCAA